MNHCQGCIYTTRPKTAPVFIATPVVAVPNRGGAKFYLYASWLVESRDDEGLVLVKGIDAWRICRSTIQIGTGRHHDRRIFNGLILAWSHRDFRALLPAPPHLNIARKAAGMTVGHGDAAHPCRPPPVIDSRRSFPQAFPHPAFLSVT